MGVKSVGYINFFSDEARELVGWSRVENSRIKATKLHNIAQKIEYLFRKKNRCLKEDWDVKIKGKWVRPRPFCFSKIFLAEGKIEPPKVKVEWRGF